MAKVPFLSLVCFFGGVKVRIYIVSNIGILHCVYVHVEIHMFLNIHAEMQ